MRRSDVIGLQMRSPKGADPELRHSNCLLKQDVTLHTCAAHTGIMAISLIY